MLQETPQQTEVNRYTVTDSPAAAAVAGAAALIELLTHAALIESYTCSQGTLASASQLANRYTGVVECRLESVETQSIKKEAVPSMG